MDFEMKLVLAMGVAAIVGGVCQVWILLDRLATRRRFASSSPDPARSRKSDQYRVPSIPVRSLVGRSSAFADRKLDEELGITSMAAVVCACAAARSTSIPTRSADRSSAVGCAGT
jgi:hypothetical protein